MESVRRYFQQKVPQGAPPELPGGVGKKDGAGSGSSFRNMLGSLSPNHENERTRRTRTRRRTRTGRRRRWRRWRWMQW